jgi:two-component system nitrogen regulation response regulator GlnG
MRSAPARLREDPGITRSPRLLIVDDLADARWVLANLVRLAGYVPLIAASAEEGLEKFRREAPDIVLLDVRMPDMDGFDMLTRVMAHDRSASVIMLTAYGKIDDAVRAIHVGAFDYVTRPFNNEELLATVKRALQDKARRVQPRAVIVDTAPTHSLTDLMGGSAAVLRMVAETKQVGPTNFPVLLTGETGTGKELVARSVHDASPRATKPFVVVDCGAIAASLLESELFGHEKGSFTGARNAKLGAFELAAGGTIFLDEIGNLPLSAQTTLLRVLETHSVHRVGGVHDQEIDFRVIAATNVDLSAAGNQQNFRADLYHRLAGFTVRLPTLRERRQDLPCLVTRFLAEANRELHREVRGLSDAAWQRIERYDWPGNVRELRNRIRRAVLMCDAAHDTISLAGLGGFADDVQRGVDAPPPGAEGAQPGVDCGPRAGPASVPLPAGLLASGRPLADMIGDLTADFERAILAQVLDQTHGNKAQAARRLRIDYKTMQTKLRKYGMTGASKSHTYITQENGHG